jgi:Fe-S-cluster-containing dehydrogenase component
MEACPTAAMSRDEKTGAVLISDDRCMGCMMCAMVCPFGAISLHSERKVAVKCDFCIARLEEGREPACVEACPTEALVYGEEEELIKRKRIKTAETVLAAIGRMEKDEPAGTPGH